MNIDDIMVRARKDARTVGGPEVRALCDEIDKLRRNQISEGITVVDVIRDMKLQHTKKLAWAAGNLAAARWRDMFGEQPPKDLRPKSSGEGTHCHALYPHWFRPEIVAILTNLKAADDAQLRLFEDDDDD